MYRKSIEINKDYAVAYGNIGSASLHEGDIKAAEENLTKALQLKYNYPIAHYNLGIVYFQNKKYEEAIKEIKVAVEQLPQLYQAWNMLGRVYLKTGKIILAKEAFQRSLEIMPNQPQIVKTLQKMDEIAKKPAPKPPQS